MKKLKLEELNRITKEEFKDLTKKKVVVVLDNIRSALNVGSIFRTCDAFAIEKILLIGITAKPPHKEINKTAIGATETVEWSHHQEGKAELSAYKAKGYKILAIEQTDESISLKNFNFHAEKPICLVFGNEVDGVGTEILQLCDGAIDIQQYGTKHSLNVAVCAGIVIWQSIR